MNEDNAIHGVGVDLVSISRIEDALARFGDRFARRILSVSEYESFVTRPHRAAFLAKQFAGKEALLKALGTGLRDGLGWHHIEILRDALGKPYLVCNARAKAMLEDYGVRETHVSLSDEGGFAVAFVTLVRR
jgi:holo-[acyl-carrier protein] synthase